MSRYLFYIIEESKELKNDMLVAKNVNSNNDSLKELFDKHHYQSKKLWSELFHNPNQPNSKNLQKQLEKHNSIITTVCKNPNLTPEAMSDIVFNNPQNMKHIIKNPGLELELLGGLSKESSEHIQSMLSNTFDSTHKKEYSKKDVDLIQNLKNSVKSNMNPGHANYLDSQHRRWESNHK